MNVKQYNPAFVLSLCMLCAQGNDRVSTITKLKNGIVPSLGPVFLSSGLAAAGMTVAGVRLVSYLEPFVFKKLYYEKDALWVSTIASKVRADATFKRISNAIEALKISTILCGVFAGNITYNFLYARTESEIKRVADELRQEIAQITREGTLTADEIAQQLKHKYCMYSDDQSKQLEWLTSYLQKLIAHADWYNQKLAVLQCDPIPYVGLLKAAYEKSSEIQS